MISKEVLELIEKRDLADEIKAIILISHPYSL